MERALPDDPVVGVDFADSYWRQQALTELDLDAQAASAPDEVELRLLAENLPSLCWIADGDGSIGWYNRRWHEYCGSTAEAMTGWGWQSAGPHGNLPAGCRESRR